MLKKVMVILLCVVVVAAFGAGCSSQAQTASTNTPAASSGDKFPTRPIEIICPYSAGSAVDANSRAIGPSLEPNLNNQKVLVTDKPGASAGIGTNYVAKGVKPDGYTWGLVNIASLVATATMTDVGFDPIKDVKWAGCTATDTFMIAAPYNSPYNSIKDVVEYLKAHPKGLSYGTAGATSTDALMGYNIESAAGVDLNMVSFNGSGEIVTSILGGHLDLYGGAWSEVKALVADKKIKVLGCGAHIDEDPDVKTFEEQGFNVVFKEAKRSVFIPSGVDDATTKVIADAVKKAVADPEYVKKCTALGLKPNYISPEDCQKEAQAVYDWCKANKERVMLGK
jgi:tripartite-type tricarboxylate transporter receptor subunit TctC